MDILRRDLRYCLRLYRREWFVVSIAVLALAIGIGANTAIFSVAHHLLLQPLPYPEAEDLTLLWLDNRPLGQSRDLTSYPNFVDWRDQSTVYQGMAGFALWEPSLTGGGEPEHLAGAYIGPELFQVLGVETALGRGFAGEEFIPGNDLVVILSHRLWHRRFQSSPGVVGSSILLDDQPHQVVGVMPPKFDFPEDTDLWAPLAPSERLQRTRLGLFLRVIGRLKPGVALERARAEMDLIAQRLEREYPDTNRGFGVTVVPLRDHLTAEFKPAVLVLSGAVAFVLLIACANVASLLLSRSAVRQQELAVRSAMGATRGRLLRQLFTESLVLALLGGGAGLALAVLGLEALQVTAPQVLPDLERLGLNGEVLLFTVAVSLLSALLFGLVPAVRSSGSQVGGFLRERSTSFGGGNRGRRLLSSLVIAEVALAVVLLIGAGLLIRTVDRLLDTELGFDPDRLLALSFNLTSGRYPDPAQRVGFFHQLLDRLEALPGVESAAVTSALPLRGVANSVGIVREGEPPLEGNEHEFPVIAVSGAYFATMGVPVLAGAPFPRHAPEGMRIAAINRAMAERYWPSGNPVGRRLRLDPDTDPSWITIVAVVGDVHRLALDAEPRPEIYLHLDQAPRRLVTAVVRTEAEPLGLARSARSRIWAVDGSLPVQVETMEALMAESIATQRVTMVVLSLISAVALFLAVVGLYGVLSYAVTQSTREIGIRIALGAQRHAVLGQALRRGALLIGSGLGLGFLLALAVTGALKRLLHDVAPTDPLTFAGVGAILAAAGLTAVYLPARRAAKTEPIVALRSE